MCVYASGDKNIFYIRTVTNVERAQKIRLYLVLISVNY